jgi:hypothetical protein
LPINIVESILSNFLSRFIVFSALLLPFAAKFFNFILFKLEKAVSVAEKYADIIIRIAITTINIRALSSIFTSLHFFLNILVY